MRLGKGWIVVAAVVALLAAGFGGNALAHSPTDPGEGGEGYSWEEMHAWCHGTEGGGSGMMGETGTGMDWGPGGMMGGAGSGMMGDYGSGGWGG